MDHLSIFLLKEGVSEKEIIEPSHVPRATEIDVGGVKGTVYTQGVDPRPPAWAEFFGSSLDPAALGLLTANASALLAVPMKNRTFAITFGYGRFLLNSMVIEPRFGLYATLNSVPADKIRSIDKKTFESILRHTREQTSKDTSIGDFGLDVERDIVHAVTGTPSDSDLGKRFAGKDALAVTRKVTLHELPELLQLYLAKSEQTTYRDRFAWIDNIREVRDKAQKKQLDGALVEMLRTAENLKAWLAVPDLLDWSEVDGFSYRFSKSAERNLDLHLRDYTEEISPEPISAEGLRRHAVVAWGATNETVYRHWPAYQCLHAEIVVEGATYLLSGGGWYEIDKNFVQLVNDAVATIPESGIPGIDIRHGENERDYNVRLAAAIPGASCLDARMIPYGGGKSTVEFCDVYDPAGRLIHVKRYAGSHVLSHLFAQATVSATAFISDEQFRRQVNGLLPERSRLADTAAKPNTAHFEIVFVIASRSATAVTLPFFSRVTLRNANRELQNYGFRTALKHVRLTTTQ
jgi:uncharacterized protein (TIGR04141 family)